MKVLWITNILFPEAQKLLMGSGELKASGGWMLGSANALLRNEEISLSVATVSPLVKTLTKLKGDKITYYVIPLGKGKTRVNRKYNDYWDEIKKDIQPEIIHIHGTEFSHGHAYMKACGIDNVVISVQGLTSAYKYYYCGISKFDVYRNITFRDMIKGTVISGQKEFKKRAVYEIDMIRMTKHIIGRTSWDRSRTWAINPGVQYHFCNETLRSDFYDGSVWNYNNCNKHSIFLSQASYPIKGLHQVLKAMPFILRHYPDTTMRIAGSNITKSRTLLKKLCLSGYALMIKRLIKKFNLEDRIVFTGNLTGEEMKKEYLQSNVFICPSTIENSPNSLGEAQILGVPCVASYVGGIMDMMKGNEDNLYRFEEVEMLAEKVCRIFADKDKQIDMRAVATIRHDEEINVNQLLNIYKKVSCK